MSLSWYVTSASFGIKIVCCRVWSVLGLFQKLSWGGHIFFFRSLHPQDKHGVRAPRPPGHVSALINQPHYGSNMPWPPGQVTPHPPTPRTSCQQNTLPPPQDKKVPAAHPPPEDNFWNSPYMNDGQDLLYFFFLSFWHCRGAICITFVLCRTTRVVCSFWDQNSQIYGRLWGERNAINLASTTGALAHLFLFIIVRRAKAKWPRPQGPVVIPNERHQPRLRSESHAHPSTWSPKRSRSRNGVPSLRVALKNCPCDLRQKLPTLLHLAVIIIIIITIIVY